MIDKLKQIKRYSIRDPDMYEFHIMALPFDLLTNQSNQVIENYQLDHGKPVQGKKKESS
jgi:hypothetical protein